MPWEFVTWVRSLYACGASSRTLASVSHTMPAMASWNSACARKHAERWPRNPRAGLAYMGPWSSAYKYALCTSTAGLVILCCCA